MAYFLTITLVGIEQMHELDFVAALGSLFFRFAWEEPLVSSSGS